MTVVRQIARLSPVLVLSLVVAAVACQQSEAGEGPAAGVDPREPTTVAEGAEPEEVGLLDRLLNGEAVNVRIPAGTHVRVRLLQPLSGAASRRGQGFLAAVADDLVIDDRVAIPSGARVTGTVREVEPAPQGSGGAEDGEARSRMALSFDAVELPSGGAAHLDGAADASSDGPKLVLPAGSLVTFTLQAPATVELALDAGAS